MKQLIIATTVLALCAPLFAQGSITTPPGGLKTEGASRGSSFGRYANARHQNIDNVHKGKAYTITEVAFRLDNWNHSRFTAMGRTWSNVKLNVAETDFSKATNSWAANVGTATPSTVYNTKADWPTQTGFPIIKPDVWGGLAAKLRFPFSKPWVYTGKNAMLLDYTFSGGSMANNAAWGTTTTGSSPSFSYYLDSEYQSTYSKSSSITRLPATRINCNDSAMTRTTGAYLYAYGTTYGPESSTITYRNKLVFQHYSYYTAPKATVIHALGLAGTTAGVNVGAKCNKLYVDLSKPNILMPFRTLNNTSGQSGTMGWLLPWNSAFANATVYMQGAWSDSQSKQLALTQAIQVTLPNGVPAAELPEFTSVYRYDTTSTTGFGPYRANSSYFPYTRYKTR